MALEPLPFDLDPGTLGKGTRIGFQASRAFPQPDTVAAPVGLLFLALDVLAFEKYR